ncbi:MAG: hypothetical protein AAF664_13685 [Planctomycetota bacterium]
MSRPMEWNEIDRLARFGGSRMVSSRIVSWLLMIIAWGCSASSHGQTRSLPSMQSKDEFLYQTPPATIGWTGTHAVSTTIVITDQATAAAASSNTQAAVGNAALPAPSQVPIATFFISAEEQPRPPLFQMRIDATRPATNTAARTFRIGFQPRRRSSIAPDRATQSVCLFEFPEGAATASVIHRLPLWATFAHLDIGIEDDDDRQIGEVGQLSFPIVASMTSVQIYDSEYANDVWVMDDRSSTSSGVDDWRSFIHLDQIVGTKRQLANFTKNEQTRASLLTWVHQGGVLVEYEDGSEASSLRQTFRLTKLPELDFGHQSVLGTTVWGTEISLGVGRVCFAQSGGRQLDLKVSPLRELASPIPSNMVRIGVDPVMGSPGYDRWLIEGVSQPPVYTFIGMLTVFMLLVGPAAYRLTVCTGRGHLMFVLAPVLAILTTGTMLVYGVCVDGFSPKARVRQVTFLDSANGQSLTRSRETHFAPRGVRAPLPLPEESVFIDYQPASIGFRYAVAPATAASFEQRSDQMFLRPSWLPVREQKQCIWMAPADKAGQVRLIQTDDGWRLCNESQMTLVHPFVQTPAGQTWAFNESAVLKGQTVSLERVPDDELSDRMRLLHDPFRPIDLTNSQTFRNVMDMIGDLLSGVRSQEANDGLLEWQLLEYLLGLETMRPGEFLALVTLDPSDCLVSNANLVQSVGYAMGTVIVEEIDTAADGSNVAP